MSRIESVLVVQAASELADFAADDIREAGYEVTMATVGEEALFIARSSGPDLVLIDQRLPDISGVEVCRRLRDDPKTSVAGMILLVGAANDAERLAGYEVGADDVVTKPIGVRELVLRMNAVLRRQPPTAQACDAAMLRAGEIELDPAAHRAWAGGVEITLTLLEFRLLSILIAGGGAVHSREDLLRDVWGPTIRVEPRTVDQHMKRLRMKLGSDRRRLETIRGIGYRFVMG